MGAVYLARQASLARLVALKVLPRGAALSERARARFLQEARALARVRHVHVVAIFDVIEQEDALAYSMEWIDGETLEKALARQGGVSVPWAMRRRPRHRARTRRRARRRRPPSRREAGERPAPPRRHAAAHRFRARARAGRGRDDRGRRVPRHHRLRLARAAARRRRPRRADRRLRARRDALSRALGPRALLGPQRDGGPRRDRAARSAARCGASPATCRATSATIVEHALEPDRTHRYASAAELADDLDRLLTLQPIRAHPPASPRAPRASSAAIAASSRARRAQRSSRRSSASSGCSRCASGSRRRRAPPRT
jgi:hypothetical protein